MRRMDKLSNYRTAIFMCDGWQCVVYAETIIVRWNDDTILLNTGGWKSVTTKRKMNQASAQFGLGFSVFQRKRNDTWYAWYVQIGDNKPVQYLGNTFTIRRGIRP